MIPSFPWLPVNFILDGTTQTGSQTENSMADKQALWAWWIHFPRHSRQKHSHTHKTCQSVRSQVDRTKSRCEHTQDREFRGPGSWWANLSWTTYSSDLTSQVRLWISEQIHYLKNCVKLIVYIIWRKTPAHFMSSSDENYSLKASVYPYLVKTWAPTLSSAKSQTSLLKLLVNDLQIMQLGKIWNMLMSE